MATQDQDLADRIAEDVWKPGLSQRETARRIQSGLAEARARENQEIAQVLHDESEKAKAMGGEITSRFHDKLQDLLAKRRAKH